METSSAPSTSSPLDLVQGKAIDALEGRTPSDSCEVLGGFCAEKLPYELLSLIFEDLLVKAESDDVPLQSITDSLRSITTVCRRWYEAARQTPYLWRTVADTPHCIPYALCLQRCGTTPLCVFLAWHLSLPEKLFQALDSIDGTKRVVYVSIATAESPPTIQGYGVGQTEATDLIHWEGTTWYGLIDMPDWPAVDSVCLGPGPLPYHEFVGTTESCWNTRSLRLQGVVWRRRNPGHVEFPRFTQLELLNILPTNAHDLLSDLFAPNLTRLLLIPRTDDLDTRVINLNSFGSISQLSTRCPQLADLNLDISDLSVCPIVHLLGSTPTVKRLSLFQQPTDDDRSHQVDVVFPILLLNDSSMTLLPALTTLSLLGVPTSCAELRALVEGRQHSPQPILELGLKNLASDWLVNEDFAWLRTRIKVFEWAPWNSDDYTQL